MYELHAILCHNGSLNRGHYFSFIRVGKPDQTSEFKDGDSYERQQKVPSFDDGTWVKFNDQTVVPTFKHVAIGTGRGGYNTSYKVEMDASDDENDENYDQANPKEDNLEL